MAGWVRMLEVYEWRRDVKILVACEESQEVCKAFRAMGHEAYSCDLEPCSGGHPEWHLQVDAAAEEFERAQPLSSTIKRPCKAA